MNALKQPRVAVAAVLAGCSFSLGPLPTPPCITDADCPSGEFCFREACAAPKTGLIVDVAPPPGSAILEQDQPLARITGPSLNLPLQPNPTLDVWVIPANATRAPFFTISGAGFGISAPLPRSFSFASTPQDPSTSGSLAISPGLYQATLTVQACGVASDAGISGCNPDPTEPPIYLGNLVAQSGKTSDAGFAIPLSCPVAINGTIMDQSTTSPVLPRPVTVQAFDRASVRPISQVIMVPPGIGPGTQGQQFTLCILQPAGQVDIHVAPAQVSSSPQDPTLMPSKVFPLQSNDFTVPLQLVLGGYGSPVLVKQQVLRSQQAPPPYGGTPLVGADIWFEGVVGGAGQFTSAHAQTDTSGDFAVMVLPSPYYSGQPGTLSLHIVPQSNDAETAAVTIVREAIVAPDAGTSLSLPAVNCDEKTEVHGTVLGPGAGAPPLPNIRVAAAPADSEGVSQSTTTDATGSYVLFLNPATYSFSFEPTVISDTPLARTQLPARAIEPPGLIPPGQTFLQLPTVTMPLAVTVDVQLQPPPTITDPSTVANSNVTVFQIPPAVPDGGTPVPVLLQKTQADSTGLFRMVLPAVDPATP